MKFGTQIMQNTPSLNFPKLGWTRIGYVEVRIDLMKRRVPSVYVQRLIDIFPNPYSGLFIYSVTAIHQVQAMKQAIVCRLCLNSVHRRINTRCNQKFQRRGSTAILLDHSAVK
jgi:hypothetical protein